jgi:ubiquitin-protein ligase
MAHNARYARLAIEYTKLMNLAARSSFIDIRPIEMQPGWPPEKYIITYTCRGIASVDEQEAPCVSEFHQVSMYMGSEYPLKEPYLRWLTPIWHPNIAHEEPHHVCTNNVQNWFAAKPLAELVLAMGEMVQYKHYHAKWIPPFPLDRAAADWVLEIAEPLGIVGANKPFDDRPLLQSQRMRNRGTVDSPMNVEQPMSIEQPKKRIRLGSASPAAIGLKKKASNAAANSPLEPITVQPSTPGSAGAIKFGKRTKPHNGDTKRRLVYPAEIQETEVDSPVYSLEISKDGELQKVETFEKPSLSIGRGALGRPVDLALEGDLTMSRLHVILERDESGAFWLTAKGQNPVKVEGRLVPLGRSVGVDKGQVIEICSYSIKLL